MVIEIEVDKAEADSLTPVEGFSTGREADPPIPGIVALGAYLAGRLATDALEHIAAELEPAIGTTRCTVEDVEDDGVL